jgi:hypothetical protein
MNEKPNLMEVRLLVYMGGAIGLQSIGGADDVEFFGGGGGGAG